MAGVVDATHFSTENERFATTKRIFLALNAPRMRYRPFWGKARNWRDIG